MVNYWSCFFSGVKLIPLSRLYIQKDLDPSTPQFKISSVPFFFFGCVLPIPSTSLLIFGDERRTCVSGWMDILDILDYLCARPLHCFVSFRRKRVVIRRIAVLGIGFFVHYYAFTMTERFDETVFMFVDPSQPVRLLVLWRTLTPPSLLWMLLLMQPISFPS